MIEGSGKTDLGTRFKLKRLYDFENTVTQQLMRDGPDLLQGYRTKSLIDKSFSPRQ